MPNAEAPESWGGSWACSALSGLGAPGQQPAEEHAAGWRGGDQPADPWLGASPSVPSPTCHPGLGSTDQALPGLVAAGSQGLALTHCRAGGERQVRGTGPLHPAGQGVAPEAGAAAPGGP